MLWPQSALFFGYVSSGKGNKRKNKVMGDYIMLKVFTWWRKLLTKQKGSLLNQRRYLQTVYLIRELITKIYSKFMQLNTKQTTWLQNGQKKLNGHFSKDIEFTNRYTKRCSTSLIIRKMQIQITMRYHLMPVRMAIVRKAANMEKRKPSCTVHVIITCSHHGREYGGSSKNLNGTAVWFSNFICGYLPKENKNTNSKGYMHSNIHCSIIYNRQPKCLSIKERIKMRYTYTTAY